METLGKNEAFVEVVYLFFKLKSNHYIEVKLKLDAILLGWASELPVMVRMNYLEDKYRPKLDDPEYWNIWTQSDRTVDWQQLSDDWQDYSEKGDNNCSRNEVYE